MKTTMVIPSYWGRKKEEGWKNTDSVYDHPTPLDEEGTLRRALESLTILENKNFELVILGVATAEDIQAEVEERLEVIIKETNPAVPTHLFSYTRLKHIHAHLAQNGRDDLIPLLQLDGYSNVRNLCVFVPHLLGSEISVLIDDDELFEDRQFMDKAREHIGRTLGNDRVLAVAGYYINPDEDYFLHKEFLHWMTYWDKFDCMNRAFTKIIAQEPRLKVTPFAFGGNLVIHRDLFTLIPFDPSIPRGEDIDFLINARMFGFKTYLDNTLSIKHDAPPKTYPVWRRVREDILRFVFEKNKLDAQEDIQDMVRVSADDLDPYPGEFLKEDLKEKVFWSNQMLAIDYLSQGEDKAALECLENIALAHKSLNSKTNSFQDLLSLQNKWKDLMEYFSSDRAAREICSQIHLPRE
ncbi:MAG: hypothetical protein V3V48_12375 [Candidatus Aminicenantaceae bacterium]